MHTHDLCFLHRLVLSNFGDGKLGGKFALRSLSAPQQIVAIARSHTTEPIMHTLALRKFPRLMQLGSDKDQFKVSAPKNFIT